jgi:LPS export ABC transporter permease LptG
VRILSRYFLASYFTFFVAILIASMMSIIVIEMLVHFDEIFGDGKGFGGAIAYLFIRLPSFYVSILLPTASFAAAFFCLALPARRHEFTAIKAGGISPQRVTAPVLCAAALLSIGTLIINETVVLGASRDWSHFGQDDDVVEFRRGTFWYHRGNTIYNVYNANREQKTLHGVTIFELSPSGRLSRSIIANRVQIVDDLNWEFQNATVRTFDLTDPLKRPTIEHLDKTVLVVGAQEDLALLNADAGTLSLGNLLEFIESLAAEGRKTSPYEAMFNARLTSPLTVLLFALLAIPLGLSVERTQSVAVSAIRAIAIVGSYYALRGVTGFAVSRDFALAASSPWILFGIFTSFGIWQFVRARR